jgi:hypothetical protein
MAHVSHIRPTEHLSYPPHRHARSTRQPASSEGYGRQEATHRHIPRLGVCGLQACRLQGMGLICPSRSPSPSRSQWPSPSSRPLHTPTGMGPRTRPVDRMGQQQRTTGPLARLLYMAAQRSNPAARGVPNSSGHQAPQQFEAARLPPALGSRKGDGATAVS